jgi:creatinine amidohydrolase
MQFFRLAINPARTCANRKYVPLLGVSRSPVSEAIAKLADGGLPFNWIRGHPLMTPDIVAQFPFDHAAQGETSLLMALCPEGVKLERLVTDKWYTKSAEIASVALGEKGRDLILDHMRDVLCVK